MPKVAFELAPEYRGTVTVGEGDDQTEVPLYAGGQLAQPDGKTFDVAKRLKARDDGVILVDEANQPLVDLLRAYPALQETKVPAGAGDYSTQTVEALQTEADERGLQVEGTGQAGRVLKDDLVAALEADDQGQEA